MEEIPPAKEKRSLTILALLYLALFLTILWLAYTDQLPAFLGDIPAHDKIAHVVLYAVAAYLGHRICRYHRFSLAGRQIPTFPALFTLFTVSEELGQFLAPSRSLDAIDLVASFAGIVLGWWLAERNRKSEA
ncbi:hypothetical protein [Pseudanabaena sp. FACHB-2040]|uniref:hypothetical protein n=1 Tax=Pseudanabaena sp. FACHB-2040 TaxID=2692859 RepID=UPI001686868D|nr:hypothetical protein [Pseudanabaena sp. FACHB-2040]MBD2256765.1 hypothetical protein [Pseudanabaena sp. FACHB-2040]